MIKLDQSWLKIVEQILVEHLPKAYQVWVFGSRVNGNPKPLSDLDLALVGDEPIYEKILIALEHAFDESILPMKVDLVDFRRSSSTFQKIITKNYEILLR